MSSNFSCLFYQLKNSCFIGIVEKKYQTQSKPSYLSFSETLKNLSRPLPLRKLMTISVYVRLLKLEPSMQATGFQSSGIQHQCGKRGFAECKGRRRDLGIRAPSVGGMTDAANGSAYHRQRRRRKESPHPINNSVPVPARSD